MLYIFHILGTFHSIKLRLDGAINSEMHSFEEGLKYYASCLVNLLLESTD